jgi:DNA-binding transcriptional ArsR family regulator
MANDDDDGRLARFPVRWIALLSQERRFVLAVAAALSSFADRDGVAWPKRLTIGELAGVHPRTVTKGIARLKELGLVHVELKRGASLYKMPSLAHSGPRSVDPSGPPSLAHSGPRSVDPSGPPSLAHSGPRSVDPSGPPEVTKELNQRTSSRVRARGLEIKMTGDGAADLDAVIQGFNQRRSVNGAGRAAE